MTIEIASPNRNGFLNTFSEMSQQQAKEVFYNGIISALKKKKIQIIPQGMSDEEYSKKLMGQTLYDISSIQKVFKYLRDNLKSSKNKFIESYELKLLIDKKVEYVEHHDFILAVLMMNFRIKGIKKLYACKIYAQKKV